MRQAKRPLVVIGVILLAFLSFGAWALSSPVGATPDEDFHLASIWCGSGEREGLCGPGTTDERRAIPDKIEQSICYAHKTSKSAACQGDDFLDPGYTLEDSRRVNSNAQYPTGYYFWSSFFASDNIAVSTLALRFAQALFFTVLSVTLWLLLPRRNRAALVGGIAVTFVPLGMFLIPSVNPSGWAIASAALLLPALTGYLTATARKQRIALGAFAVLAALLGLGARGDSAAYTVVAVLAAVVLSFELTMQYALRAILPAVIVVAAAVAFLTAGQTGLALDGMTPPGNEAMPAHKLLFENFVSLPELFAGVLGQNFDSSEYTGLGWLDTPMPGLVWGVTTLVFAGVLFIALYRLGWRRALALSGIALATFAIPFYILMQSEVLVGYQVQPRYVMPLIVLLVAAALTPALVRGEAEPWQPQSRITQVHLWIIAVLLSVANCVALFSNMRRYVSPGNFNLNDAAWWWRAVPSPMLVWFVGSAAFAGLALLLVLVLRRSRAIAGTPDEPVSAGTAQAGADLAGADPASADPVSADPVNADPASAVPNPHHDDEATQGRAADTRAVTGAAKEASA